MNKPPQTTEERLQELAHTLDGFETEGAPMTTPAPPKSKPEIVTGPKTKLAVLIMAWGFGLFWVLWVAIALLARPLQQITDLLVIPFSALVVWLIFQGHRWMLIAAVRKTSGFGNIS
jgi:hypothetical protein